MRWCRTLPIIVSICLATVNGAWKRNLRQVYPDIDGTTGSSGCWTRFPTADSVCYSEFGAEWTSIESENCGFLGLGKMYKCQRQYPGCEATVCYSSFVIDLCDDFNDRLPVHRGEFSNCSPGFWSFRCCPN